MGRFNAVIIPGYPGVYGHKSPRNLKIQDYKIQDYRKLAAVTGVEPE